jgi:TP901 family phage tail tape measure protein
MTVHGDSLEILLRVIGIRTFQAQMYEARRSVESLGAATKKTDAAMMASGRNGTRAMTMLKKVSVGTAAAVGAVAAESLMLSIRFQKEMTLVQTQAGARLGDMKMLHSEILKMSHDFPQGPIELARGLYHMQSIFGDSQTALNGLRIAAMGASVGNADLAETTSALGAAVRAIFPHKAKVSLQDFRHIMSVLHATIGAGNMSMQDMIGALGTNIVPTARAAGLSLEELGGWLATLVDQGQRADNAATHLRMAITLLSASSKIAVKNLRSIGISSVELGATMHGKNGAVNALKLIREGLEARFPTLMDQTINIKNWSDAVALANRFKVVSRAFGGARSAATIFMSLQDIELLERKTKQVHRLTRTFGQAWDEWRKTADAKLHTRISGLQADLVELGDVILKPGVAALLGLIWAADQLVKGLTWLVHAVKNIAHWFGELPGPVKDGAEALGLMLAQFLLFKGITKGVLLLRGAVLLLTGGIETLRVAMFLLVVENPILLVIMLIIAGLILLYMHSKKFRRIVGDAFHWVLEAAKNTWSWIKGHWPELLVILMGPFGLLVVGIIKNFDKIESAFKTVLSRLVAIWNKTGAHIPWLGGHITDPFAKRDPTVILDTKHARTDTLRINPGRTPKGRVVIRPLDTSGLNLSPRGKRVHVPDPVEDPFGKDNWEVHVHSTLKLDGKDIYKSNEKQKATKRARR